MRKINVNFEQMTFDVKKKSYLELFAIWVYLRYNLKRKYLQ